jgi:hypothetical protein
MKPPVSAILWALAQVVVVATGLAAESTFQVHPDRPLQVIRGLGFEIQSDSIGSGNQGLPENRVAVPHDLVPAERRRLAEQMLQGFRYCRLAGGLYWRGLDEEKKVLLPRWPEQLTDLRELLREARVEGLSLEYWSPAPFWKANGRYVGSGREDRTNTLRCFGPDFGNDPVYHGDVDRFLADFAAANIADIRTLTAAGLPVVMWGLQNEPQFTNSAYSTCRYFDDADYVKAYRAVAASIRAHDPKILLFADTGSGFPRKIATGMGDPAVASLVDAYAVHTIGEPSENVSAVHAKITAELPPRPWFQNEYEYLDGGATPARCLNTVQHIMNSFQLAGNPTWFWLHALKPFKNAEASGYSLGFWRSLEEPGQPVAPDEIHRWRDGPVLTELSDKFAAFEVITATRGDATRPGLAYDFNVNQPVTVYLLVEDCGDYALSPEWAATDTTAPRRTGGRDRVYKRSFGAGTVAIPEHTGREGERYGAPHLAFVEPSEPATFKAMIGVNTPIQIRSEALVLERSVAALEPGHWSFNRYNWHAVGSFVKRLPWDSVALAVDETVYDADARILAFRRPNGKHTIVISNRTGAERAFSIATGLPKSVWSGHRYTPESAGVDTMGVAVGESSGALLKPLLPTGSWEFWEER